MSRSEIPSACAAVGAGAGGAVAAAAARTACTARARGRTAEAGVLDQTLLLEFLQQIHDWTFEVHAIDYLLKPFDRERFQKTLQHAREQIALAFARDRRIVH